MDNKTHKANKKLIKKAHKHLSKTRKKSTSPEGGCLYSGIGCAFSVALKNPKNTVFDSYYANELIDKHNYMGGHILKKWAIDINREFANELQACHDNASQGPDFFDEWSSALKVLCKKYGYKMPKTPKNV